VIKAESDYYPWGGELQFVNNDSNDYKFTGKKRDSETGLDYFGARYYSNGLGRWVSPDWAAKPTTVPYAEFGNPQSLNLYAYVGGNPASKADPDGHQGPGDILQIVEIANRFANDVGGFTKSFFTGAGKQWSSNVRANADDFRHFGEWSRPEQNPHFSNDAERAGGQAFTAAGKGASYALIFAGKGKGEVEIPGGSVRLPNEANVVRGGSAQGANSIEGIAAGTGTHPSGVTGFSVESAAGKSVEQLIQQSPTTSRYGQVGCCTVGQIREAGGDVVSTSGQSPNHATVTGLTPQQANKLFTPTIPNPVKKPGGE
jgi:RHS repeat-associated protein